MKRTSLLCAALFLAAFSVYLRTLNPVFAADDSPETTASCVTLGIQHPPGYPLDTLVGHLFSWVPCGNPGFRLNAMAALWGSLTLVLLFLALRGVLLRAAPGGTGHGAGGLAGLSALGGTLLLAFSRTFWSQCLSSKGGIYTLQAALLGLLVLCLLGWESGLAPRLARPQSSRLRAFRSPWFLALALAFGLGLSNHWETQVFFLPSTLIFGFLLLRRVSVDPRLPSGGGLARPLWMAGLLFAAGLSLYLYLPLRSALDPVMDWGHPAGWAQLKWVLFRQEYTDMEVGFVKALMAAAVGRGAWADAWRQWGTVAAQGRRVLWHLVTDLGPLTWALSLAGLAWLWRSGRRAWAAFMASLAGFFVLALVFYFHLKSEMIWILDVFLIPAYFAQAFCAGAGLMALGLLAARGAAPRRRSAALLLVGALGAGLAAFNFGGNFGRVDERGQFWAYDYGLDFMDSMKRGALCLAEGDFNVMPVYYLQRVEGRRPDLDHLTDIFLSLPWGVDQAKLRHPDARLTLNPLAYPPSGPLFTAAVGQILAANRGKRPLYCSMFHDVLKQFYPQGEAFLTPSGLASEYFAPDTPAQWRRALGLMKALRARHWSADIDEVNPSTQFMLSNYTTAYLNLANWLRGLGKKAPADAGPYYRLAIQAAPIQSRPQAWTYWGIYLCDQGKPLEGLKAFQTAIAIHPIFEAYSDMAGVCNSLKRYPDAIQAARQAIALSPRSPEPYNNLAIAQYYTGRRAEAVATLEQAQALAPENAQVAANLKALRGH